MYGTVPVFLVDRVINEYILDVISTVSTVCTCMS